MSSRASKALLLALLALLAMPSASSAGQTFTVNRASDLPPLKDGDCEELPGGDCTLFDAITEANTLAGRDEIRFQDGINSLIELKADLPVIGEGVDIVGPGAGQLTIDGLEARRILDLATAAGLDAASRAALAADPDLREASENDLSTQLVAALPRLPAGTDLGELETAATRVGLARSFHNAAVRDTRAIRLRRIPRALRLAGHRSLPQYFEIDDTRLAG